MDFNLSICYKYNFEHFGIDARKNYQRLLRPPKESHQQVEIICSWTHNEEAGNEHRLNLSDTILCKLPVLLIQTTKIKNIQMPSIKRKLRLAKPTKSILKSKKCRICKTSQAKSIPSVANCCSQRV